mmetsp:Transcript_137985/g.428842  ORF Transcript_137985/g.428842 Transcript_137985/m.428842 type:complete len:202 (+) Transcript_137985:239-844(+)
MPIPHCTSQVRVLVPPADPVRVRVEEVEDGLVLPHVAVDAVAMSLHLLEGRVHGDGGAVEGAVARRVDGRRVAVPGGEAVLRVEVPDLVALDAVQRVGGLQRILLVDAFDGKLEVWSLAPSFWIGMTISSLGHVLEHALVRVLSAAEGRQARVGQLLARRLRNGAGLRGELGAEPRRVRLRRGGLPLRLGLMLKQYHLIAS